MIRSALQASVRPVRNFLSLLLNIAIKLIELGLHDGVATGEFFDSDVMSLVVGEAEVAVGADEGVFGLLQVFDRLINFVDRGLELFAR